MYEHDQLPRAEAKIVQQYQAMVGGDRNQPDEADGTLVRKGDELVELA